MKSGVLSLYPLHFGTQNHAVLNLVLDHSGLCRKAKNFPLKKILEALEAPENVSWKKSSK